VPESASYIVASDVNVSNWLTLSFVKQARLVDFVSGTFKKDFCRFAWRLVRCRVTSECLIGDATGCEEGFELDASDAPISEE
jgi:hypothetical protein